MGLGSKFAEKKLSNGTQEVVSQCKIVYYDWTTKELTLDSGNDAELSKADALDISSQIVSVNYSKNKSEATGKFSFVLSNSPGYGTGDWKDILKRGSWCVIYMSQDGDLVMTDRVGPPDKNAKKLEEAKKIRCVGFIDRVAPKITMDERGSFDVTYVVSGRCFGVVYEDTEIWHNVFKYEKIMLDAIATSQLNITGAVTVDKAMSLIHDLFFNPRAVPGAKVNDQNSLTSIALQWLMPRNLLQDIGLRVDSTPYWGELSGIKNFSPTAANLAIEKPTDYLSGNAWKQLKKLSVPEFHELFTELSDTGLPQLIFRPNPHALSKRNYPSIGRYVSLYKDLPAIQVPAIDLIDADVGEDNHNRYNSFLATVSTTLIGVEDNISLLDGSGFPKNVQDSIKRYGFRPMHVTVDSIVKNAERANGKGNPQILREFNWLLYDYWNNAIFAESGTVEMIGRNEVKVGKCMTFTPDTPYLYGKRYYVEGYTDSFVVGEKGEQAWTQTVTLTHGFEEADLKSGLKFGERGTEFTNEGEFTPANASRGRKNAK